MTNLNPAPTRTSVKYDEQPDNPRQGPIGSIWLPTLAYYGGLAGAGLPPNLPMFRGHTGGMPAWYERDFVLRHTVHHEPLWATAVQTFITKQASQTWDIGGDKPTLKERARSLLNRCGGGVGLRRMLQFGLRDYATTDNGMFIEIERASRSRGSRIVGLHHLDSLRCWRTGDSEIPVIYRDKQGREHEMRWYQVAMLSANPDPSETYYGSGMCAAAQVYGTIRKLAAMERYLEEKVSGRRPLAIDFVGGVHATQLESILATADADQQAKKQTDTPYGSAPIQESAVYMGSVIAPSISKDGVSHVRINLAELPDRFNRMEEWQIATYVYANALGLDFQDLAPLSGGSLGSGQQSETLDEKATGRLGALWAADFAALVNWQILPDDVPFTFVTNDLRDRKLKADVHKVYADVATVLTGGTPMLVPEQGLQWLADNDVLDANYLTPPAQVGGTLGENEKVSDDAVQPTGNPIDAAIATLEVEKAETSDELDPAILDAAADLFDEFAG